MICGSFFSSPPLPLFPSTYYTFHLRSVFGHMPTVVFPLGLRTKVSPRETTTQKKTEKNIFWQGPCFPILVISERLLFRYVTRHHMRIKKYDFFAVLACGVY